jgi:hypothetical protein
MQEISWKHQIPRTIGLDSDTLSAQKLNVSIDDQQRVPPNLEIEFSTIDDYSNIACGMDELYQLALPEICRAIHIEYAASVWNTAHAIDILRDFAEFRAIEDVPQLFESFQEQELATLALKNDKNPHDQLSEAFTQITRHFGLGKATWDQIALALQAASTLERVSQTRTAMKIACSIVNQDAGD